MTIESNHVKIIECFNITGLGVLTEIQHHFDGIPPNSQIIDPETNETWIIKKRVLHGILIFNNSEKYFECESDSTHVDSVFKTQHEREIAVEKELNKRKQGIYQYLLEPLNKKQKRKLVIGSILKVKTNKNLK